jgi:glycosyltransferase involved in cell wall biosynthesis
MQRVSGVLHVISEVATPHNNNLMQALIASGCCTLKLYYSVKTMSMYSWKEDIFHAVGEPVILGERGIYWRLVWYALTHPRENYLFVGWPNNTARLLLVLFWLLRQPFLFWSDHPDENAVYPLYAVAIRQLLYHIVKTRARRIFLVGRRAVGHFQRQGYSAARLVNLPVFVRLDRQKSDFTNERIRIRSRYESGDSALLFVSGSRLTAAKGFDILVEAAASVRERVIRPFKVVIVGQGEQEPALRQQIAEYGLTDVVVLEPWMEPDEFEALIASSDVYVHPARFDAFGGGTLHAMALGVPVIGSDGAGAVAERVVHGWNGQVFPSGRPDRLADCMLSILNDRGVLPEMGQRARRTAEEWPVERGVKIISEALV